MLSYFSLAQNYPIVNGHGLEYRFVRINTNFLVESDMENAMTIMTRAKNSCYNGIVISDGKFGYLDAMPTAYFNNLKTFLDSAAVLKMQVIPEAAPFGYSRSILFHNPNLASSLPVIEAPFVVENIGGSNFLVNPANDIFDLKNSGFEATPIDQNVFPNWTYQDSPGIVTFWDQTEAHSGNASALINNPNGNGRISQIVEVSSFRDYKISFWIKTENLNEGNTQVYMYSPDTNRPLNFNTFTVESTQDWTEYNLTFNTLNASQVRVYVGVWNGTTGKMWIDDIQVVPTKFNNIVRRPNAPVTITNSNNILLTEGVDTDPIIDPLMGNDPYIGRYSVWHQQPTIGVPPNSSLGIGDTAFISYYHTGIIKNNQITAALTEQESIDIVTQQLVDIKGEFDLSNNFEGWMFTHDEIRVHGWGDSPSYGSPGADLNWNFNELYSNAKSIDTDANVFVWSDMFDPYHNAYNDPTTPYYLVNGFWNGSGQNLPTETIIMNWNYPVDPANPGNRTQSVQFFSDEGHQQILAGYYDENTFYTADWLSEVEGIPEVVGVMYTTWSNNYSELENWADATFGDCDFLTTSCPSEFTLANGNRLTGTETGIVNYATNGTMESEQTIGTNAMVEYDSGSDILLLPGFNIVSGAMFAAFRDGCLGAKSSGDGAKKSNSKEDEK